MKVLISRTHNCYNCHKSLYYNYWLEQRSRDKAFSPWLSPALSRMQSPTTDVRAVRPRPMLPLDSIHFQVSFTIVASSRCSNAVSQFLSPASTMGDSNSSWSSDHFWFEIALVMYSVLFESLSLSLRLEHHHSDIYLGIIITLSACVRVIVVSLSVCLCVCLSPI